MSFKTWLPLVLAIVLGLIAAKVSRDVIVSRREAQASAGKLSQVVIAAHALTPGQTIAARDLTIGEVAKNSVPDASFNSTAALVGRTVQISMGKGQPIVETLLAPQGAGTGLQALVPKGMRAITIEINEFSSVGGMIQPGCFVDVLATIQGKSGVTSKTVVQNVKVTAVGQRVVAPDGKDGGGDPYKSVTLLATPEQAETIELAATLGRPRLSLRSGRDGDLARTKGVDVAQLLGENRTAVAQTPAVTDPFIPAAELRSIAFAPPATQPTTQPAIVQMTAPVIPSTPVADTRSISIIRAGQETFVTVPVAPVNTGVVGTDGTPVDAAR
jgi:pilus assembly protein CpaB